MRGFGAFAICFTLLFTVWYNQYKFFRRYGLRDTVTVVLNGALLFVVLFYVYPLKFLFSSLVERLTRGPGEVLLPGGHLEAVIEPGQVGTLMLIFGAGYLAVFAVFVLLYLRAYRKREELDLNSLERFDTLSSVQEHALHCSIAIISIGTVLVGGPGWAGVAGVVYMLTGVVMAVHGRMTAKRRKRIEKSLPPAGELETV